MPIRYILPANHVVKINVNIRTVIESNISQLLTPKGSLTIIIIGEVNGIILNQKASVPSGLSIIGCIKIKDKISGIVTGSINCCVSDSASTADPTAANNELYIR